MTELTVCGSNTVFEYEKGYGGVFKGCGSLNKVTFMSGIPEIPKKTFYDCDSVSGIVLRKVPIKDFKGVVNLPKPQAAVGFMNAYIDGMEFPGDVVAANKKWIKSHRKDLLDIVSEYTQSVIYMTKEILLDNEDAEYIKKKAGNNAEIVTILLEYADST